MNGSNFIKKSLQHRCFLVNFLKRILKSPYISELLQRATSAYSHWLVDGRVRQCFPVNPVNILVLFIEKICFVDSIQSEFEYKFGYGWLLPYRDGKKSWIKKKFFLYMKMKIATWKYKTKNENKTSMIRIEVLLVTLHDMFELQLNPEISFTSAQFLRNHYIH